MSNEREMLLRRLSGAQFAAWEMHMFLDTHPNDKQALEALRKYDEKEMLAKKEYEDKFGQLNSSDINGMGFDWVSDPWPWEKGDN